MVEGISSGVVIEGNNEGTKSGDEKRVDIDVQDFRDADLIVCHSSPFMSKPSLVQDEEHSYYDYVFKCYAIYGSTVVESSIDEPQIRDIRDRKIKVVWAVRKPYILNGDKLQNTGGD